MSAGEREDVVSRPSSVWVLVGIVLFQGVSGVLGGLGLVLNPDGDPLGLSVALLEGTPFQDYLVPGIILLVVLGLYPFVVLYGLVGRERWGLASVVVLGTVLVGWIVVQVALIGYQSFLQPLYGFLGIALLLFARLPSVHRYVGENGLLWWNED